MTDDDGNIPLRRRAWTVPCVDWRDEATEGLTIVSDRGPDAGIAFHPPAGEYARVRVDDFHTLREAIAAAQEFAMVQIRDAENL